MANNKMNIEGKNYSDIPVWRRYTLTIEEAARYYHIGEGKLRTLIDTHPNEDFYVMNGNREDELPLPFLSTRSMSVRNSNSSKILRSSSSFGSSRTSESISS